MGYISFPIQSNYFTLLQQAVQYIQTRAPAWEARDGNLDMWILQAVSSQASDLRELATDVPNTIFRYFGDTVLGIPPNDAVPAQVTSTWFSIDALGHLIEAGTLVGIRDNGGVLRGFQVQNDVSILPGLNQTNEGEVTLIAIEAGIASTNIGGVGVPAELIDPLDFVSSVVLFDKTSGGVDPETIDEYMNRLSEYMRGLSTRPVLAEDYARMANNVPGIHRAVALDGYNPADDSYFNERMITVVGIDQFGLDLPQEVKDDLDDMLEAQREVNFIINVIDPSRTTIDVTFNGFAVRGYSAQEVEAQAVAAITSYLSPMNWGRDPSVTTAGADETWIETQFVRYNKVMQVIESVQGLDYLDTLTIARGGDTLSTSDVALDLPAALTEPGTINGVVSSA
jgi:hypothetical protein